MSSVSPAGTGLLGTAKTLRGKLNLATIVVAFVLSFMVKMTYDKCNAAANPAAFTADSNVDLMHMISMLVLVLCVLLFAFDIAVKMKWI